MHTISWKCHQARPASCPICDLFEKQAALDINEDHEKAQREHDMKMVELEARLQYQQKVLKYKQAQKDREREIEQKENEIEVVMQKIKAIEEAEKMAKANSSSQISAQGAPSAPTRDQWEHQKRAAELKRKQMEV